MACANALQGSVRVRVLRRSVRATKLLSAARSRGVRASVGAEFPRGRLHVSALDHPPPSKVTMQRYSLTHLSDEVLRKELRKKVANENEATAELIAHIAEFDARKLYLPAAYPSMLAYCVGELGLSEAAAKKRVWVARAARTCPSILDALARGRVHLSGLVLLAARMTPETAEELLTAVAGKTRDEIEKLLAARFPKAEVTASVKPVVSTPQPLATVEEVPSEGSPGNPRARVVPLSAEAFAVQFTRSRDADERFRYLQHLLGHQVSRGDIDEVYDRAVRALIAKMEKVRFGACDRPRAASHGGSDDPRHIPAHVKRAVFMRDGGQCTFVSESGHRCEARGDVEFDHKTEVAGGGQATADNLRLRCRGHNQHTAEQTFGAGFMQAKREQARTAAASLKTEREKAKAAAAQQRAEREKQAEESRLLPHELEVLPWLHQLGCREGDSRIAARRCREMEDAPLEHRVKRALTWFGERCSRTTRPAAVSPLPAGAPACGVS
jgi:5-methylcytosine-specific restriction endonuclease McrA